MYIVHGVPLKSVQHIFIKYILYSITVFSPGIPPVHSYDNSQPFSPHLIPFSPLSQRVCIDIEMKAGSLVVAAESVCIYRDKDR
jgi:hypothetical protein